MIAQVHHLNNPNNNTEQQWQAQLRDVIKDPAELLSQLQIHDKGLLAAAIRAQALFPLRAPRAFVSRIEPGNPKDPLLRQLLPQDSEYLQEDFGSPDPLKELDALAAPGVLHKYRDRVLLLSTEVCAGHCRYCFRRHFPYRAQQLAGAQTGALDYIRGNPDIKEVILSGGDPLSQSDKKIASLSKALDDIPHLKRLRIHTRTPIFIPSRVTDGLCGLLNDSRLRPVVVVHCNHANEIDAEVETALQRLSGVCILLNQSVLLRGVNDDEETLVQLSERLFECRTHPYYLHVTDPVSGSADFQLSGRKAQRLLGRVATQLPGYLVPKLVRECPGKAAKTNLAYILP